MSKKVLLLGGAGFIGFHILQKLAISGGYDLTIGDNFFRGKMDDQLRSLVNAHDVKVINADFTDPSAFDRLDSDYHQVYMLASVVGVEYTSKMPNELIRINTQLIMNTLEWLKQSACQKVLFTSTSECYAGAVEAFGYRVPTPEDVPLCIEDITHPRFTYAVTKMLGESGFMNYAKVYGFDCTIVRYHNVYGPRMGFKHVIPQVVKRFAGGEDPFRMFGHDQTRSFNFIDDAANGTIAAMETDTANNEIFHIGDMNAEITIEELLRYIGAIAGFSGTYVREGQHSGSVSRRCPDTSKAKAILGYEPETDWKTGVRKTVEWYLDYYRSGKDVYE